MQSAPDATPSSSPRYVPFIDIASAGGEGGDTTTGGGGGGDRRGVALPPVFVARPFTSRLGVRPNEDDEDALAADLVRAPRVATTTRALPRPEHDAALARETGAPAQRTPRISSLARPTRGPLGRDDAHATFQTLNAPDRIWRISRVPVAAADARVRTNVYARY